MPKFWKIATYDLEDKMWNWNWIVQRWKKMNDNSFVIDMWCFGIHDCQKFYYRLISNRGIKVSKAYDFIQNSKPIPKAEIDTYDIRNLGTKWMIYTKESLIKVKVQRYNIGRSM